jgi:DNA (cytosine-5)-methyltransferase 1
MKRIRVVELFAGVGGFRLGLEQAGEEYKTVWSNQWEPGKKAQPASRIYEARFGSKGHSNENIEEVIEKDFKQIPAHDLLVGGFPCQDYSVARTLSQAAGLIGRKGVLWWSIYTILRRMGDKAPRYLFLENVDRLLKSPASQRGRDFAVMLASLSDLGYAVEWRVVNAADYGFPQRRRRVFIMGYKQGTKMYKTIKRTNGTLEPLVTTGVLAQAFEGASPALLPKVFTIEGKLQEISKDFSHGSPKASPFSNSGTMVDRVVSTIKVDPVYEGERTVLGDLLQNDKQVTEDFYIDEKDLPKWISLKGAKKEMRTTKAGHTYYYSEGGMVFPEPLDKPSRTIVTGEGGKSPSRFKHVIMTKSGKYRRLTPTELERLDMFPDGHTDLEGVSDTTRAFIMGNALVVGVIRRIGESLFKNI